MSCCYLLFLIIYFFVHFNEHFPAESINVTKIKVQIKGFFSVKEICCVSQTLETDRAAQLQRK